MTTPYAIVQYEHGNSGHLGILAGGQVHAAPADWPSTAMDLFGGWHSLAPRLRTLEPDRLPVVPDAHLLAPLTYPAKVLCAGANYYDHAAEMGTTRPDPTEPPFFFLKPPSTTVVPTGVDIVIRDLPAAQLDWEAELAVVIADRCSDLDEADALGHVAGYAVANDLSARGRFSRPKAVFPPFGFDWLGHKGFDGSCPIGPGITPVWFVPDPQRLAIRLMVDGEVRQNSSTASMVVGVAGLVTAASRLVTLEAGDVVLTGTPAGVGLPRQRFLADRQVVRVEIDGLGAIENRIISA